eukprot:TRINITY_DN2396_c0_g1_i3.p1 TRINITY_DN2396_c0_g1~~TRINITY_DN2396_c0_g1_i3.p1  ORF type:complete len:368 (-),score=68.66 TRINITY_DN2396_c0_g1_i3:98-1201(-)
MVSADGPDLDALFGPDDGEAAEESKVLQVHPALKTAVEQLAAEARRTGCPESLLCELHFPRTYPVDPPSLRLIRPRLEAQTSLGDSLPPSPVAVKKMNAEVPLSFSGLLLLPELAAGAWYPGQNLGTVLLNLHERLVSDGAKIDMSSVRAYQAPSAGLALGATLGIPTVANCMSRFPVACLERAAAIFPELAAVPAGRVVLPHTCAMEVGGSLIRYADGSGRPETEEDLAARIFGYPAAARRLLRELEEFQKQEVCGSESGGRSSENYALLPDDILQLLPTSRPAGMTVVASAAQAAADLEEGKVQDSFDGAHFFWLEALYDFNSGRHAVERATAPAAAAAAESARWSFFSRQPLAQHLDSHQDISC